MRLTTLTLLFCLLVAAPECGARSDTQNARATPTPAAEARAGRGGSAEQDVRAPDGR